MQRVLFNHPVDLLVGCFPHPPFPELLHVRAAVADFLPADGEGDNPVRAVTLQGAGADFEIFHTSLPVIHLPVVRLFFSSCPCCPSCSLCRDTSTYAAIPSIFSTRAANALLSIVITSIIC